MNGDVVSGEFVIILVVISADWVVWIDSVGLDIADGANVVIEDGDFVGAVFKKSIRIRNINVFRIKSQKYLN